MCDNFYQINNNSMSTNSSYNAITESNDQICMMYPNKQDHIVSPSSLCKILSKEEIKAQYQRRKSSTNNKSQEGNSQQNTKWTSKQFLDDFLSDNTSDEEQEIKSKDSLFRKRIQQSKRDHTAQIKNQYQNRDNKSLGLCDQEEDGINEDENRVDDMSLEAEEGEKSQLDLAYKLKDIPTCKDITCYSEADRQFKSLHELPSQMLQKQNFLLGEKTPHYYENMMNMEDGIDEIDEIDEIQENYEGQEEVENHRKKLSINPIFHCGEVRLRFRVDSLNNGDENMWQENDDVIVKNIDVLKKNHQQLKQNKLKVKDSSLKSCINF